MRRKNVTGYGRMWKTWNAFGRMEAGFSISVPKHNRRISTCYLEEARAMLAGKDTRGKNRCTKLEGDE
jgi:hypothetical protein